MLLAALVEGISLALLVPLLAVLTGGAGGNLGGIADGFFAAVGAATPFARLTAVVLAFSAALMLRAWVLMLRELMLKRLQLEYTEQRRLDLLRALAEAEWSRVAALRHARVTSAIGVEIGRVALTAHALLRIAVAAIMLAVQLLLTLAVSWAIGLLAILILIVAAAVFATRLRLATRFGEKLSSRNLALMHTAGQFLGSLKQAAAENGQRGFVRDFTATIRNTIDEQWAHQSGLARFHFGIAIFMALTGCVVLLAGAWLESDVVALLAALLILSRMAASGAGLQRDVEVLASALPAHRTLQELEDELASGARTNLRPASAPPTGPIHVARATYLHEGDAGVRDLSVWIEPGEIVGVTGPSGAGKTTFIDLVAGLLQPQSGEVRIGETLLVGEAAQAWRGRIAYVGQDAALTNHSIRQNLAAGADGADDAAMWEALATAAVADAVRAMPLGLDTPLAERGGRLSGGERQRIALARAILRRPRLLILDEATNAIDIDTEWRIMERVARLSEKTIILIVAHRKETLRQCTRILSIEGGRLIGDRRRDRGHAR